MSDTQRDSFGSDSALFQSVPLGEAQRRADVSPPPSDAAAVMSPPVSPPVVVDIDMDDLPMAEYDPVTFRLPGGEMTVTLRLEDDAFMFEVQDRIMKDDSISDIVEEFFEVCYHGAVDGDGNDVEDGLEVLKAKFFGDDRDPRGMPFQRILTVMKRSMETWMSQNADASSQTDRASRRRAARMQNRRGLAGRGGMDP